MQCDGDRSLEAGGGAACFAVTAATAGDAEAPAAAAVGEEEGAAEHSMADDAALLQSCTQVGMPDAADCEVVHAHRASATLRAAAENAARAFGLPASSGSSAAQLSAMMSNASSQKRAALELERAKVRRCARQAGSCRERWSGCLSSYQQAGALPWVMDSSTAQLSACTVT
jgi:hypothetical protein